MNMHFVVGKCHPFLSFSQVVIIYGKYLIQGKIFFSPRRPPKLGPNPLFQTSIVTLNSGVSHTKITMNMTYGRCGHRTNEGMSRGRADWGFSPPARCPYRPYFENNRISKKTLFLALDFERLGVNWARAQSTIGGKHGPKTNYSAGGLFRTASTHVKFSEKGFSESDLEKSCFWEFSLKAWAPSS